MRPLLLLTAFATACATDAPCPEGPHIDPMFSDITEDVLEAWAAYEGHACVDAVKTYDSEGHLFGPGGSYYNWMTRNVLVDPDAFTSSLGHEQELLHMAAQMPHLMCDAANQPLPPVGAPPGIMESDGDKTRLNRNRHDVHTWCAMGHDIIRWHERVARICAPDVKPRTAWLQGRRDGFPFPHDGPMEPVISVQLVDIAPAVLRFERRADLLADGTTLVFRPEGDLSHESAWRLDTTTWKLTYLAQTPQIRHTPSHRFDLYDGPDTAFGDGALARRPDEPWLPEPVDSNGTDRERLAYLQVSDQLTVAHDDVQFPLCGPRPAHLQWFPKKGIAITWPLDESERLPTVHVYAPPAR